MVASIAPSRSAPNVIISARWWRNPIAIRSRVENEENATCRSVVGAESCVVIICLPRFLLGLQGHERAHAGTGDKGLQLGVAVLGNEQHISGLQRGIFLQITLLLHLLHVEDLRRVPALRGLAEQQ